MTDHEYRDEQTTELRRLAEEKIRKEVGPPPEAFDDLIPEDIRLMFHELCVHQIELETQNEELRRIQTDLDFARARYFDLYDMAPVGYCTLSPDGLIMEANLTAANLLGVARGTLIKQPITRYIHPEDQDAYYRHRQEHHSTGEIHECELRMVRLDGSMLWAHLAGSTSQQGDGTSECRLVISDITDRKRTEEALKQSEQQAQETKNLLRLVLDTIPVRLFWKDCNSVFLGCNALFARDAGYQTPEELIGLDDYRMGWKEQAEMYRQDDVEVMQSGQPKLRYEEIQTTPDGEQIWLSTSKVPLRDTDGRIIGILGSYEDITQHKWAEEELLKAQKLEALGLLAGGIAHDFNNILMIIMGNISFAKMQLSPEDKAHERLSIAEDAALKAKDLTRKFLTFAKGGAPVKSSIATANLIRSFGNFAMSGGNATCAYTLPDDLWNIEADEAQIGQVITNILLNADQSMQEGGCIRVQCENAVVGKETGLPLLSGRYVKITITDQGSGIAEENLGRIFDPYFTTKESGRGLGLASAYAILKKHGGYISVASIVGTGTTFTLFIPAAVFPTAMLQEKEPQAPTGSKKILVMDDDEVLLQVVGIMLEEMGHHVVFAYYGKEALSRYADARQTAEPIDLVIMDLTIPGGMGGKEAIQKLLELDPKAKAIVSSGYCNDPVMADYKQYGFKGVIAKPYRFADLSTQLQKAWATN